MAQHRSSAATLRGRALGALTLTLALAGCGGGGLTTGGSEAEQVSRLMSQGFTLVADGRGTEAASALRYNGPPGRTIVCRTGSGGFGGVSASNAVRRASYAASQTGGVRAHVVVGDGGGLSGLYVYHVERRVTTPGGALAAREFEKIEFRPGETGRFSSGTTCRANL